ncbi:MAG: barstar family protein [Lachnospiraceae bacterium]|nr:barstar family protein [Lachnospiraceae bacterium]
MRKIIFDLRSADNMDEVHEIISVSAGFPEWYGRNLDALYDLLTDICEPTCIGLFLPDWEGEKTGKLTALKAVFRDAEEENDDLGVITVPEADKGV